MGQNFYMIKLEEAIVAEHIREHYVPVIVKALMAEYFEDPCLTIRIIRETDYNDED